MNERLATGLLVGALLRRVNDAGGFGVVRVRGDAQAGGVLLLLVENRQTRVFERGIGPDGVAALIESTPPGDDSAVDDYWHRRRARDPDLWVIELDIPDSQRFAAETMLAN